MLFKHPYWKELQNQLTKRGYELDYADTEEKIYQWKKEIFDQTYQYINLSDTFSADYKSAVACGLGITSPYLVKLFNSMKLSSCYDKNLSMVSNPNDDYKMINVFGVALHWLCLNAAQPLHQFEWPSSKKTPKQDVQLLLEHIDTYWPRILSDIDTEEKLILFLNNIDEYPKKTPAKGPVSEDPDVYSGFYSLKLGKIKEAQKSIELAYKKQQARIEQLFAHDKKILTAHKKQQERIFNKYREEIDQHI